MPNLVNPGRNGAVPLIRFAGECLRHELVPDGSRADDSSRVVAQRLVVRVSHPDGGRQAGGETDRPIIFEIIGGARLGSDVTPGQRQVAPTAETHASVAVVGHDGGDDEGDTGVDSAVLHRFWIVGVDRATQPVLDTQNRGFAVPDAERREG